MPTKVEQLAIEHIARAKCSGKSRTALEAAIETKWPGSVERARTRYHREMDEARFEGRVPDWVKRLVRKYERPARSIRFVARFSRTKPWTSGHCTYWNDRVVVTFGGNDLDEQRYVVLHEIAHANQPSWENHGEGFYDELYRMVKAEGLYRKCIAKGHAHWGAQGLRQAARRARRAA